MTTILILPGWQDSGPEHWQGLWLKKYPNAVKVEQKDFMFPKKEDWVAALDEAISRYDEVILVAHSLGCPLVAHWASGHTNPKVKGALLVAPGDSDATGFPQEMQGFNNIPKIQFPFPAMVVASSNDKWMSLERAKELATAWGARLVNIGDAGHINTAAGFGEWPQGEELLKELMA